MKRIALVVVCLLLAITMFAGCELSDKQMEQLKGNQGEQGLPGEQGEKGEKGETGENAEKYKNYNIYVTCGSLPTLYAGLHAFGNPTTESYMIYERRGTFDNEKLLEYTGIKQIYDVRYNGVGVDEIDEFRAKVKELYDNDNDARFHLYCDDLRAQLEITLFLAQGIPEENFDITFLTDGTGTYSSAASNGAFPYRDANAYSTFLTNKANYDADYIQAATTGSSRLLEGISMWDKVFGYVHRFNALYAAQKKNVRYWMQYPELLENLIQDERMKIEFGYSNIEKVTPTDLLNQLSPVKKAQFAMAGKMDTDLYGSLFKQNEKKDLVITGTSPAGEGGNFENVLDRIIELYGDEYNLFFKAHPSWGPENVPDEPTGNWLTLVGRKEMLEEKGVTLLPSITPMEIMMWFYPHLYVGGYNSSLYMNVDKYQTQFFIVADIRNLSAPLPDLYDLGFFATESGGQPQVIPINYTP